MLSTLSDLLYESKFESQLCMIYDSNKCLCGTSDAFPFKYRYTFKLDKGDYTAKVQVRLYIFQLKSIQKVMAQFFGLIIWRAASCNMVASFYGWWFLYNV